jgi:YD repeat-containing protein
VQEFTIRRELARVKIDGVAQASLGYDAAGRRTSLGYANGRATAWTYDAADRIVTLDHAGVQKWEYPRTDEGDPLAQEDQTMPGRSESYSYDPAHRLRRSRVGSAGERDDE